MHEELAAKIEQFKEIGIQYTFDGFVVAELLTQLDALAKVNYVEFKNNCLSIWLGDLTGTPKTGHDTPPRRQLARSDDVRRRGDPAGLQALLRVDAP